MTRYRVVVPGPDRPHVNVTGLHIVYQAGDEPRQALGGGLEQSLFDITARDGLEIVMPCGSRKVWDRLDEIPIRTLSCPCGSSHHTLLRFQEIPRARNEEFAWLHHTTPGAITAPLGTAMDTVVGRGYQRGDRYPVHFERIHTARVEDPGAAQPPTVPPQGLMQGDIVGGVDWADPQHARQYQLLLDQAAQDAQYLVRAAQLEQLHETEGQRLRRVEAAMNTQRLIGGEARQHVVVNPTLVNQATMRDLQEWGMYQTANATTGTLTFGRAAEATHEPVRRPTPRAVDLLREATAATHDRMFQETILATPHIPPVEDQNTPAPPTTVVLDGPRGVMGFTVNGQQLYTPFFGV